MAMPPDFDAAAILATLDRHRVVFAVIGGMGAILHGVPLSTWDVDVLPRNDRENLDRLVSALREMDARLRVVDDPADLDVPWDARSFTLATTITFTTRHGNLDVSLRPDGLEAGWSAVADGVTTVELGDGVEVPVASLADIIRSKEAAGRPKDLAALPMLRELQLALEAEAEDEKE